jgi:hypothetical protein
MEQVPQCVGAVMGSTQMPQVDVAPGQAVIPAEQPGTQAPAAQTLPAQQARPHAPQFPGSDIGWTQVPLQNMPSGQSSAMQVPAVQGLPVGQPLPHEPQLWVSISRLTQTPPQQVVPGPQPPHGRQLPITHDSVSKQP